MSDVKNNNTSKKKFAAGLCFYKFFWIFVIGCIFGCIWEEALGIVTHFLDTKELVWTFHRGLLFGPFNPVYGCGALLLSIIFADKDLKWWQYLIYGSIAGGGAEYLASFFQEKIFGSVSWDYSSMPLNINGRTNVPYMVFWGLLACIWAIYAYPKLSMFIESWPNKIGKRLTIILMIYISFDIFLTSGAALRQKERKLYNNLPSNIMEVLYDNYYNDAYFDKYFGNKSFIIIKKE